ncbi:Pentachlorophenol 4-monooxygenase [compost metagenome]
MGKRYEVLVVGAGPTGLMLSLWLARAGVSALVIDDKEGPAVESRAVGVQARTMETYDMLGLGEAALREGIPARGAAIWRNGKKVASAILQDWAYTVTPHPYLFVMGQDRTERMLLEDLRRHGRDVRYGTRLQTLTQGEGGVTATLRSAQGLEESIDASFLAGCDGAHSAVRQGLGIGFSGGTYPQRFFVSDVIAEGPLEADEVGLCFSGTGFLAFFPMRGPGHFRVIGIVPHGLVGKPGLAFEDLREGVARLSGMRVKAAYWFSTYNVHHRVAETFRRGNAFLLGDAGHLHSPVGGQGMNTGLMDAANLGWKLGLILQGQADERLLESYEPERRPFACRLVATTDRIFTLVSSPSRLAGFVRDLLLPSLFAAATHFPPTRQALLGIISQTGVRYPDSPLSWGRAGEVSGGDRLPWIPWPNGGSNFDALRILRPHAQVYGAVPSEITRFMAEQPWLPLVNLPGGAPVRQAGVQEGAFYLLRPDGYVAYAASTFEPEAFMQYFRLAWGVRT